MSQWSLVIVRNRLFRPIRWRPASRAVDVWSRAALRPGLASAPGILILILQCNVQRLLHTVGKVPADDAWQVCRNDL